MAEAGTGSYRGVLLSTEDFQKHKYYDLQSVPVRAAEMKIHWVSLGEKNSHRELTKSTEANGKTRSVFYAFDSCR